MDQDAPTPRWPFVVALLLTLLVAAGLRLYRLPELPLGLHYDEAANGILAAEIARGAETPIFIPAYTGKEVLFFYWTGLWMRLLGPTELALRLSAALAGLATVAATAWAVRELLHGRRGADWVALLSAAFLATSFWHLVLSRYGFRAVTQPLLQALTVAALWRGLRFALPPQGEKGVGSAGVEGEQVGGTKRQGALWLLLAGLLCGLTAYTYLAARAFPLPLAAALAALLLADRGHRRARLGQMALFVAAAALALAPLTHYWLTHPGSFLNRTQQVAAAGWAEAWAGVRACLGMFFLRGDPYVRFNLPGHPLFDPVTAVLFLGGIIIAILGSRSHVSSLKSAKSTTRPLLLASTVFLLSALPAMLLPSALATGEITPSNLRAAGLLPFIYVFPALGLWTILDAAHRLLGPRSLALRHLLPPLCCLLLLALSGFATACLYFHQWATSAALYYAADGDLADVAAYLNQADLSATTPYVASVHYRHPTLAFLAQDYGAVRWLRGGSTVVFPARGEGLLIFPRSASQDLAWVQSVLPDGAPVWAPPGPDGTPAFHAYRVGPAPAADPAPTHPLTADLGHAALLLGYDVVGQPRSGKRAEVAVWWQVLDRPGAGDYGPLTRLADSWGFAWGEKHHFHYPSEQWTMGEWVVDHLSVPVAPGAPPGDYRVRFSLYSGGADALLPVLGEGGRYSGTTVALPLRLARGPALSKAEGLSELDELGIRARLDARAGSLALLGFNLDTTTARPGERLYLTLFWWAQEAPLPDRDVHLVLGDATLYAGAPVHDTYPLSRWAAGELVADRYAPRLPRDTPAGDYPLRLRLIDPATGHPVSWSHGSGGSPALNLGTVAVRGVDRSFEVPPISHPLTATLGGQVELLGYDLPAETVTPGDTLTLTLYWRALVEMEEDYTVFTHLVGAGGSLAGQRDGQPVGGSYPTSLWLAGEVVADEYEIPVRVDAAPGAHRLEVGMYVAETGTRLGVDRTGEDRVMLQKVIVTEP